MFNPRNNPIKTMSDFEVRHRSTRVPLGAHDVARAEQAWRGIELMIRRKESRRR